MDEIFASIEILQQVALLRDEDGSVEGNPLYTHHFIRLFIEAGFSPTFPFLVKSKEWFKNLPDEGYINPFKIKSLIYLGEGGNYNIQAELKRMVDSQRIDGRFHLALGYLPEGDLFSTLVAVDILISSGNTENYRNTIESALDWIKSKKEDFVKERDKGYAILLMTKYDPIKYEDVINYLLASIDSRIEQLTKDLSLEKIEEICWIIYDLMPLYNRKDDAKKIVDMCMKVLKENITYIARNFIRFPKYWKIMIGTRLIMALSAYYGKEFFAKKLYENFALKQFLEYLDKISRRISKYQMFFKNLVGKWLISNINVEDNILEGGFSGSLVYRLRTSINIPELNLRYSFPSLIVKLSDKESFEREINNYKMIPDTLKTYFVEITEPRVNIMGYEGIIMEDLTDHYTLLEFLKAKEFDNVKKQILGKICRYLKLIYSESKKIDDNQSYIIQQIYKGEILKSLSSIISVFKDVKNVKIFEDSITPVINNLMKIISQNQFFNSNFLTLMHGDLNLRNIMISLKRDSISVKLIDIDKLTLHGDYAYDIGELIVDLDIQVGKEYSIYVENEFKNLADQWNDINFTSRLTIAKITSLLKLAKVNMNKGELEKCIELFNKTNEVLKMLHK
jgi:hypothetical protein